MALKDAKTDVTAPVIDDILHDLRLARLFTDKDLCCALQLWVLHVKAETAVENRLVYGRLIPYNHASGTWSASDREDLSPVGDLQIQVARLNLYLHAHQCGGLLRSLSECRTLEEISEQMGLGMPEAIKTRFGTCALSGDLAYKPVTYLLNKDAARTGTPSSPHAEAGALSASIAQLEKVALLDLEQDHGADMAGIVLQKINTDTGRDFRHGDASRLGDIELLVFPTLDDNERSLLRTSRTARPPTFKASFDPVQLSGFAGFQFRLRITNDKEVVHSELALAHRVQETVECIFELTEHLYAMADAAELEIYGLSTDEPWRGVLCCRWGVTYVRQLNLRAYISGSEAAPIKHDWLEKSARGSTAGRVASVLTPRRQTSAFSDEMGGRGPDPWVRANRKFSELLERADPPRSGGGFFPRVADSNGEGRLQFAEWLKALLSKHQGRQIALFDPYFNALDLAWPFLSGAEAADYLIFTSLPKEATEGVPRRRKSDKAGQQRNADLVAAAHAIHHSLNGARLRIYGLKEGWLHDRYILILDQSAEPLEGYHLSNSFQAASDNHPMLVTPIPPDTLPSVEQYKSGLLQLARSVPPGKTADSAPILTLFDSAAIPRQPTWPTAAGIFDHESSGDVISDWTGELSLRGLHGSKLQDRMADLKLIQDDVCTLVGMDRLRRCLSYSQGDFPRFIATWQVLGNILANSPAGDSSLRCLQGEQEVLTFLARFLEDSFKREADGDAVPQNLVRIDLLRESFDALLYSGYQVWSFIHPTRYPPLTWAEYYAIQILWECTPVLLLELVAKRLAKLPAVPSVRESVPLALLSQILSVTAMSVDYGIHDDQREALLGSPLGMFRWMGLHSIEQQIGSAEHAEASIPWLVDLPGRDRVKILGWLVQRSAGDVRAAQTYARLVTVLHANLPAVVPEKQLSEMIHAMRGHMKTLPWAAPWLFRDVVHPLLMAGRAQWDDAGDIWVRELEVLLGPRQKDRVRLFSLEREGDTTNAAAFLFAHSSAERRSGHLNKLHVVCNRFRRAIQRPLASTSDWGAWDDALMGLLWLHAFARLALFYLQDLGKDTRALEPLCADTLELGRARSLDEWRSERLTVGDLIVFVDWVNSLIAPEEPDPVSD